MLVDRRTFTLGSAAVLSGCATMRAPRVAGCTPLPPVLVDQSRLIRTVAGLRPYRRQGFVVRSDQLGDKRLIHNYGHGGGGITLSWGTSKLATELGIAGHNGPVAVIGSGAVGLATARLVQEAGLPVTMSGTLRYDTMYVEMGRYLRQMIRDIETAGGKFQIRRFGSPAEIGSLAEALVFNCTGLGSRELFNDLDLHPARGQLAILEPQPEVRYALTGGPGYMFPRPDGILLGGTFELDQWDTTPDPQTIAGMVADHKRFFASLRCTA